MKVHSYGKWNQFVIVTVSYFKELDIICNSILFTVLIPCKIVHVSSAKKPPFARVLSGKQFTPYSYPKVRLGLKYYQYNFWTYQNDLRKKTVACAKNYTIQSWVDWVLTNCILSCSAVLFVCRLEPTLSPNEYLSAHRISASPWLHLQVGSIHAQNENAYNHHAVITEMHLKWGRPPFH